MNVSNILEKSISFYRNKEDKVGTILTIGEALKQIENEKYKDLIFKIRNLFSTKQVEEAKILKSTLPAFTFSGVFVNGHQKTNLAAYNNLVVIDIDKIEPEKIDIYCDALKNDEYIFSYWLSPSGYGIKGLVCVDYAKEILLDDIHVYHKAVFYKLKEYFFNQYRIELDSSGNDTSRLCFVSYDPEINIKDEFSVFIFDENVTNVSVGGVDVKVRRKKTEGIKKVNQIYNIDKYYLNPEGKNDPHHREILNSVLRFLKKRHLSITDNYEQWFRVAFAIANSFSCDIGLKYYLRICELDGCKYDEIGSRKILKYCYENSNGDIKFATILFYAQKVGFKTG